MYFSCLPILAAYPAHRNVLDATALSMLCDPYEQRTTFQNHRIQLTKLLIIDTIINNNQHNKTPSNIFYYIVINI
jgi:hypothetical protein